MPIDWFRNETWSDAIEQQFNRKLARSKLKEQYLRVQASMLARSHPEATLRLLEQYFQLPNDFEHAQAQVDKATACIALNRISDAIAAYEAAIAREEKDPRLQTMAWLDLPFLIATRKTDEHYDRALELLEKYESRLMFPVDQFKWHAVAALIASERGDNETAGKHAQAAIEAAESKYSGFDERPEAGLVRNRFADVVETMRGLADSG
jgi:tetratricopeptide (TPR) repeat protein